MTERLKQIFEFKITLGTIISIILYVVLGYAAFVELKTNHTNLDREFRQHEVYDDSRFKDFATKESRQARDIQIDKKLDDILDRVKNLEKMHMRDK